MAAIFVDTAHLLAILVEDDDLHENALAVAGRLAREHAEFVTTPLVLAELLAAVSRRGPRARIRAVEYIEALRAEASVTVSPLTPALFDEALALYKSRHDQRYSLTDCVSMILSRQLDITDVLTSDHDFEHEGFTILL